MCSFYYSGSVGLNPALLIPFALPDVFIRKQPAGDLSIPVHPNNEYADYKSATGKIRIL